MRKRILLVDISVKGHRFGYIEALMSEDNSICLLPEDSNITFPYIKMQSGFENKRNLITYFKLIKEINMVTKQYSIEIVHLLCGDALYRFFGISLSQMKAHVFVTFHHMVFTNAKKISIQHIFHHIKLGIVHTDYLYSQLRKMKVCNVGHVEYPVFGRRIDSTQEESKKYFDLPCNKTVITIIGGTHRYKGLDILLEALNTVKNEFYLFVCGPEQDYKEEFIQKSIDKYKEKVKLLLCYLDEREFQHAINAADIIVLPYKFEFDGASGPLAESTVYRKLIIASNHGSLGRFVMDNHLGFTFDTENSISLACAIDTAIKTNFVWDETAEAYRKSLTVENFIENYNTLYKMNGGKENVSR